MKKILITLFFLLLVASLAVKYRYQILIPLATTGETIPLNKNAAPVPGALPSEVEAFVTLQLDANTFAIAEPYSWARNFNYLFLGNERALLFDAGVGHYDIRSVVESITDLPLTFMPSHFHYDHTGQVEFESLALLDLPHIRAQAVGNTITPTWGQYLGSAEGLDQPTWQVDEWIAPGSTVDLGGRELTLLFTPGHTDNSVSLHDQANNKLYSGDFIGRNGINAYYPGGNLGDYLQTAEKIVSDLSTDTQLLAAHAQDQPELPTLTITDVRTLRDQLKKIKAGELSSTGFYPVVYSITPTQKLNAEPKWLQNWQPTIATE